MTGKLLGAAVLTVVTLAVAGCGDRGDNNKPTVLPRTTASSSSSATPTPTVPLPTPEPVATEHTQDGATAFTRYYIEVLNRAYATGDTAKLKELSAPTCKSCANYVNGIGSAYSSGHLVGGQLTIKDAATPKFYPGGEVVTIVDYSRSAMQRLDSTGQVISSDPENPDGQLRIYLLRQGEVWLVAGVMVRES